VWIQKLLCEVGQCPGNVPTLVYHDNHGSISWAGGGLHKAKHVLCAAKDETSVEFMRPLLNSWAECSVVISC
jgi:hypothetical protein